MTAFSLSRGRRNHPDPSGGTKAMSTTCIWVPPLLQQDLEGRPTTGPGSTRYERRTGRLADVADLDEEQWRRLKLLCEALNEHKVSYVVFGSFAGRLQGAPLRTLDVDVVPESSDANLQRLCDALNSLAPRWRVDDVSAGLKIDGGKLEPRHIRGSSIALGLVTRAGMVDIVMEPAGFERGYRDLAGSAVTVDLDGTTVRVGTLDDLIVSKRLLAREKDLEHLPLLEVRRAELTREHAAEIDRGSQGPERGKDRGMDIGF